MEATSSARAGLNSVLTDDTRRLRTSDRAAQLHLAGKPSFEQSHRPQIAIPFATEKIVFARTFDTRVEGERKLVEPVEALQMQYGRDCDTVVIARGLQRHEEMPEYESVLSRYIACADSSEPVGP